MSVRQITLICISYVGHQVLLVGRFSVCYLLLFCQISELDFTTCHLKLTVRELVGRLSLSGRYNIGQCLRILSIEPVCNLDVQWKNGENLQTACDRTAKLNGLIKRNDHHLNA